MKKWIYIALLFVCAGCDMTLLPETHITEEDVMKDLVDVEKCFMSAYMLHSAISSKIDCDRALCDDMVPNFTYTDDAIYFYNQDVGEMYRCDVVSSMYSGFYKSIAICNETLNQLEHCPKKDTAAWEQLKGEALALRAYNHFSLVNYYGRPYFDKPESNPGIVLKMEYSLAEASRSTVQVVYDSVLSDLNRAYALLNSTEEAPVRFTQDGVTALLCRVYLFMNRWDEVIKEANKLIGKYSLPSDVRKQFEIANGPGEIFTLDFSYDKYGFHRSEGLVADKLTRAFSVEEDERFDFIKGDRYEDFDEEYFEATGDILGSFITVVTDPKVMKIGATYKALRIAEVYLNRAEAYCELGQDDLARKDLKTVVENNGVWASYIDALSGKELMEKILTERAREFMGEGYRALDLLRKGLPVVRYYTEEDYGTKEPQQILEIDHFSRILPIPHSECYLNTLVEQNTGYPRDTKL